MKSFRYLFIFILKPINHLFTTITNFKVTIILYPYRIRKSNNIRANQEEKKV